MSGFLLIGGGDEVVDGLAGRGLVILIGLSNEIGEEGQGEMNELIEAGR